MRRLATISVLAVALGGVLASPSQASTHVQVGGSDNVGTAITWSGLRFDDGAAPIAILGRDDNFADALGAGALAGITHGPAPFLVTPTSHLDGRVTDELARLGTDFVRIVGGTDAIAPAVEEELQERGYDTQRLAGANRIETAVRIASEAVDADGAPAYPDPPLVLLARAYGTGTRGFADSVGGGMLAGTHGAPLVLTDTTTLSQETSAYLDSFAEPPDVWILGGTAAVSQSVEDQLAVRGFAVERIAGDTRFGTADRIAVRSFQDTSPASVVALVDGLHVDAWLSGFAASSFSGGAVLLTNGNELPQETRDALERIDQSTEGTTALYCAPHVPASTCQGAHDILNG